MATGVSVGESLLTFKINILGKQFSAFKIFENTQFDNVNITYVWGSNFFQILLH